jgi:cytoskeleton protein RodZ
MQTLGERLRAEREKKGRSIPELVGVTRIRSDYFEAIENDRPEEFPGPFFYRSFLRQYAALLELPESVIEPAIQRSFDDERAVAAERSIQQAANRPDVPPLPTGRTDLKAETRRWLTRLTSLLAVLVLCSGAYFAWLRWGQRLFQEDHSPQSAAKSTLPAAAQHPQPASVNPPAVPAPATPVEQQLAAGQTAPPAIVPTNPVEKQLTPEQTAPTSTPASKAEKQESVPLAAGPSVGAGQEQGPKENDVVVQASARCWVDAWRDGKRFYGAMLRAGSQVGFAEGGTLRLRFGDAGAVTVRLKGKPLAELGPKGQVRTIEVHNGEYRPIVAAQPAPVM